MLDPQLLRNDIEVLAEKLAIKGYVLDIPAFQALEEQRKLLQVQVEDLQANRNSRSKLLGKTKAQGGDVDALMQEVAAFADQLKQSQVELEKVQTADYQMVLMDLDMPVMDGYEATKIIRQMRPDIASTKVLAMTAHAHISKDKSYLEHGMDDFVLKPFEPEDLFYKVRKYVKK